MPQPCRGVAQLVAHLVWDQGVGSSNLSAPTNALNSLRIYSHSNLADIP